MTNVIIDATDLKVGRLASKVAKMALLGDTIDIVNCEKAVISGKAINAEQDFLINMKRGTPAKGPFVKRASNMLVKRIIRGMLPYRKEHGERAYKNIRCYIGVPTDFAGKDIKTFEDVNVSTLKVRKFVTVGRVAKFIGGKQ